MKYTVMSSIIMLALFGCQNNKTNQGELFYGEMFLKLIDFGAEVYTYPSKDGTTLANLYETTPETDLTTEQIKGKREYEIFKNHLPATNRILLQKIVIS